MHMFLLELFVLFRHRHFPPYVAIFCSFLSFRILSPPPDTFRVFFHFFFPFAFSQQFLTIIRYLWKWNSFRDVFLKISSGEPSTPPPPPPPPKIHRYFFRELGIATEKSIFPWPKVRKFGQLYARYGGHGHGQPPGFEIYGSVE